jgi:hypothetical protein
MLFKGKIMHEDNLSIANGCHVLFASIDSPLSRTFMVQTISCGRGDRQETNKIRLTPSRLSGKKNV